MLCQRGDVAVQNRQCVHGSFANASSDARITFVWGFFPRDSVAGVEVEMPRPSHADPLERKCYTDEIIRERARLVQIAIEARAEHRPHERPFAYQPSAGERAVNAAERREALRGYARGTIFV
jgi:hypothetical protein